MTKRRFYTPLTQLKEGIRIYLPKEESLHITKSLRLERGDKLEVFNGDEVYEAEIYSAAREAVRVKLLKKLENTMIYGNVDKKAQITLYISLIKLPRLEIAIQKAVELGVDNIVVYTSEFTSIHPSHYDYKSDRFNKILLEACKQARISTIPNLEGVISFEEVINRIGEHDKFLLLTTEEQGQRLTQIDFTSITNLAFLIGPEGGFSPKEIDLLASKKTIEFVNFGPNILRSETAAIAVLAALQVFINDY